MRTTLIALALGTATQGAIVGVLLAAAGLERQLAPRHPGSHQRGAILLTSDGRKLVKIALRYLL